jgi:hypothetical protein
MKLGDKIYYTGDCANIEGIGEIIKVNPPDCCGGETYDVKFEDGRIFKRLYPQLFDTSPGRRFWPLQEWQEGRQRRIEAMKKHWEEQNL